MKGNVKKKNNPQAPPYPPTPDFTKTQLIILTVSRDQPLHSRYKASSHGTRVVFSPSLR